MKKTILFLLLTVFSIAAHAIEAKIQVWQADGTVVTFSLDEEPVTTYADGNLIIKTSKETITYPLENVRKYTYFIPNNLLLGDADGNGKVDANDVKVLINYMNGSGTINMDSADLDGDNKITIADIIKLVNLILSK